MKLDAILGTVVLGSLLAFSVACSGSEAPPADDGTQQPGMASGPAPGGGSKASHPTNDPAATTDPPATTTGPAAPAEPVTCDSLAKASPAGKLTDVQAVNGMYPITPKDVYATTDEKGLHVVLTETANPCAYFANELQSAHMNELTFDFQGGDAQLGPATVEASSFAHEAGIACLSEEPPPGSGFVGTAWGGGSASGTLTITARKASLVEGTVSITNGDGTKTTFTFSAPICTKPRPVPGQERTCCAAPEQ